MSALRVAAFLALSAVCAQAAALPFDYAQIPEQLKEVVPEAVTKFYAELTPDDKKILKEVAANHAQYQNEDQALEALKAKSEKLYNKATELRNLLKEKINSLKPAAKTFVENIIATLRSLKPKSGERPDIKKIREVASGVITQYTALDEEAKNNLQETFPNITKVIKNEKFQQIAKTLIQQPKN